MTHLGTLLAVLIYFWRDVWRLILGTLMLFRGKVTGDILAGTVPAVLFGFVLKKLNVPDLERNITVVAWNTVIYGVLMLIADMYGRQEKTINEVTLKNAVLIGRAQALALKLRPWSTGWRAIGSSVGAGAIARLSQGR